MKSIFRCAAFGSMFPKPEAASAAPVEHPATYKANILGGASALFVVMQLMHRRAWVEVQPLEDDEFDITVKWEHRAALLDLIAHALPLSE